MNDPEDADAGPPSNRFSLSTLLLAMTVMGVVMGFPWLGMPVTLSFAGLVGIMILQAPIFFLLRPLLPSTRNARRSDTDEPANHDGDGHED